MRSCDQSVGSTGHAGMYERGSLFDGVLPENSGVAAIRVAAPPCPLTMTALDAKAAYAVVLNQSGALPRDSVDQRIVEEVRTRTGHIVAAAGQLPVIAPGRAYPDSDGDGMADDWEVAHGLDPNRFDAWGDRDRDGWTNLDEFLEARSRTLVDHR